VRKRIKPVDFEYPRKLKFECDRCTICCGNTTEKVRSILLMPVEAHGISNRAGQKIEDFAQETGTSPPYTHRLKKTSDGKCVFLKGKSCAIYAERPLVCRFYPFELKCSAGGKHIFTHTSECPHVGRGKRLTIRYFADLFRRSEQTMEANARFLSNHSFRT
jgi:Fe-S-cluster containining protein